MKLGQNAQCPNDLLGSTAAYELISVRWTLWPSTPNSTPDLDHEYNSIIIIFPKMYEFQINTVRDIHISSGKPEYQM